MIRDITGSVVDDFDVVFGDHDYYVHDDKLLKELKPGDEVSFVLNGVQFIGKFPEKVTENRLEHHKRQAILVDVAPSMIYLLQRMVPFKKVLRGSGDARIEYVTEVNVELLAVNPKPSRAIQVTYTDGSSKVIGVF